MFKKNIELRHYIKAAGVNMVEVAQHLSVHESSIYRWLGYDLSDEKIAEIKKAVDAARKEKRQQVIEYLKQISGEM